MGGLGVRLVDLTMVIVGAGMIVCGLALAAVPFLPLKGEPVEWGYLVVPAIMCVAFGAMVILREFRR